VVKRLCALDVECDAPPYVIVRASRQVGLQRPEDVRWTRLSQFPACVGGRQHAPGHCRGDRSAVQRQPAGKPCVCSRGLPLLAKCTFTFNTGRVVSYWMGQCQGCRTIFWDELSDVRSRSPAASSLRLGGRTPAAVAR
jgi:hypothetical protein